MRRVTLPVMGMVVVLALFGALAFAHAQPAAPMTGGNYTLPGLEGIPRDQLFSHFAGATYNLTDKNGAPLTVKVTPGTVSSVNSTTLTITPNGQNTNQTFNITTNTAIHGMPKAGSLEAIASGDQVVVITEGTSMDAVAVFKHVTRAPKSEQPGTTNP